MSEDERYFSYIGEKKSLKLQANHIHHDLCDFHARKKQENHGVCESFVCFKQKNHGEVEDWYDFKSYHII